MCPGGRAGWSKAKQADEKEHAVVGEAEWVLRVKSSERPSGTSCKQSRKDSGAWARKLRISKGFQCMCVCVPEDNLLCYFSSTNHLVC